MLFGISGSSRATRSCPLILMPFVLASIKRSYKLRQTRHGTRRRSEFSRLAQLIRSLQLSEALQVRIELAKESNETSLVHGLTISGRRDGKLL